jgi:hypothetical protein
MTNDGWRIKPSIVDSLRFTEKTKEEVKRNDEWE